MNYCIILHVWFKHEFINTHIHTHTHTRARTYAYACILKYVYVWLLLWRLYHACCYYPRHKVGSFRKQILEGEKTHAETNGKRFVLLCRKCGCFWYISRKKCSSVECLGCLENKVIRLKSTENDRCTANRLIRSSNEKNHICLDSLTGARNEGARRKRVRSQGGPGWGWLP